MRWTRRRVQTVTTRVPVVAWVVFYAVALANADPLPPPETAIRALVVPPLLWVVVLRHWWSGPGSRMSAMDLPGRLLAVAVAALPERRRAWGRAMTAELAEVQGRSARWRFVLSIVRATLRLPVPAPTVLVTGGVAASIAVTVIFLRREPAAAQHLPPAAAVYLAAVLAGCLWVAVAAPRWLGASRLAPHLGAAAAVVFAAWFWLAIHTDEMEPPIPLVLLLAPVFVSAPVAVFSVPAFAAGRAGRSFRSGLQAAVWTVTAMIPLTFAIWLPAGLRRHAIDGRLLIDGEVVAPRRREPGRCLGLLPRHPSRARPHPRRDRCQSRSADHPSRRPQRSALNSEMTVSRDLAFACGHDVRVHRHNNRP